MRALDLVGTYDLDPNRVADIIFTEFQQAPSDLSFMPLLQSFNSSLFPHLLGFKFQHTTEKCQSLCEVSARCIKAGLFSLDSLWGYLRPEDLHRCYTEYECLAQVVKRSLDVVIINADTSAKDKDLLRLFQKDFNNQKLGLLTELIRVNHWECIEEMLVRFQDKLILCSYPGMTDALCQLVEWVIDPVYQGLPEPLPTTNKTALFPCGTLKQATNMQEVQEFLVKVLPILGIYIGAMEDTYAKVCKTLQHLEDKDFVINMLNIYIFPALSLAGVNVVKILWATMQDFPYNLRYHLYRSWKNYSQGIVMVKQSQTV